MVENPKPGIIYNPRQIQQSRLLQPGSIKILRGINPAEVSVQEEEGNMDPFEQVMLHIEKAFNINF